MNFYDFIAVFIAGAIIQFFLIVVFRGIYNLFREMR